MFHLDTKQPNVEEKVIVIHNNEEKDAIFEQDVLGRKFLWLMESLKQR